MPGLEQVVRPVIFPDVRPRAVQPVPLTDDDEQDIAILSGNNGQVFDLAHSSSVSFSRSRGTEQKRRFDVVRVKNPEDEETYVDVEVARTITSRHPDGTVIKQRYAPAPEADNIEVLSRKQERSNPDFIGGTDIGKPFIGGGAP